MRIRLLLALLVIASLFYAPVIAAQETEGGGAASGYEKKSCTCQCKGQPAGAATLIKGDASFVTEANKESKCQQQCARTCGGFTDCPTTDKPTCSACCEKFCQEEYSGGQGNNYPDECKTSCKSACDFRKLVNGIRDIIYAAAGIVGALMLIIHGIRLAVSRDPRGRDDAKSSMWHVIIALIIIALAASLVDLFINIGLKPAPAPPGGAVGPGRGPTASPTAGPTGGGSAILEAKAEYVKAVIALARDIEKGQLNIFVRFQNNEDTKGRFTVVLTDSGGIPQHSLNGGTYTEVAAHDEGTIEGSTSSAILSTAEDRAKIGIRLLRRDEAENKDVVVDYEVIPIAGAGVVPSGGIEVTPKDYCISSGGTILTDKSEIRFTVTVKNNMVEAIAAQLSVLDKDGNLVDYAATDRFQLAAKTSYDATIDSNWKLWGYPNIKDGFKIMVSVEGNKNPEIFGAFSLPTSPPIPLC